MVLICFTLIFHTYHSFKKLNMVAAHENSMGICNECFPYTIFFNDPSLCFWEIIFCIYFRIFYVILINSIGLSCKYIITKSTSDPILIPWQWKLRLWGEWTIFRHSNIWVKPSMHCLTPTSCMSGVLEILVGWGGGGRGNTL